MLIVVFVSNHLNNRLAEVIYALENKMSNRNLIKLVSRFVHFGESSRTRTMFYSVSEEYIAHSFF